MADGDDLKNVRYSAATKNLLVDLQDTGQIGDRVDGFRLAVAVAIALGCTPRRDQPRQGWLNYAAQGTIDTEDNALRTVVQEVFPGFRDTPYRAIEDLAEQGAHILLEQYWEGDRLLLPELLETVAQSPATPQLQ